MALTSHIVVCDNPNLRWFRLPSSHITGIRRLESELDGISLLLITYTSAKPENILLYAPGPFPRVQIAGQW